MARWKGINIQSLSQSPVAGPVNHASVLGQHLVIINSFEDAHELLDLRGGVYSSRPKLVTWEMYAGSPRPTSNTYEIPIIGWDGASSSVR